MSSLEKVATILLDHNVLRQNLREKADQSLTMAHGGGLFKLTPELLSFVEGLARFQNLFGEGDAVYVRDEYGNPIPFTSDELNEFIMKGHRQYQEIMNDLHNDLEETKKIRKADQL